MINVQNFNSQSDLRLSNFGFCSLNDCNQFENLEILYYPEAPNTSTICSTGEMTAVSNESIRKVVLELAPSEVDNKNFPICLIQYYSTNKKLQIPFIFRFAI